MNKIIISRYFAGMFIGFILTAGTLIILNLFFEYEFTFETVILLLFSITITMSYILGYLIKNNKTIKIILLFLGIICLFLIGALIFMFYVFKGGFGS